MFNTLLLILVEFVVDFLTLIRNLSIIFGFGRFSMKNILQDYPFNAGAPQGSAFGPGSFSYIPKS